MAPDVAAQLDALRGRGQVDIQAGRISQICATSEGTEVTIAKRTGGSRMIRAARIVNCSGPRTDVGVLAAPLIANLRRRGFLRPDALNLGIDSADCALLDHQGAPSRRLFALGPLTRAAWWEVTAVPEINVQIEDLVRHLSGADAAGPARPLPNAFNDLGAGI